MINIVGIGGTIRPGSSAETALKVALGSAREAGASVRMFGGESLLRLPHYGTPEAAHCLEAQEFLEAIRTADGVLLASPGYHGSVSGLVKNAIDYLEETSQDARAYLDGVPVGLIATASGWQATVSTLAALRSIVHALRAWPTPLGATIKSHGGLFEHGRCTEPATEAQLRLIGNQVMEFARSRNGAAALL